MKKMESIILFALLAFSVESRLIGKKCDGEVFHGKKVIKTNINSPYMLAIDYDTNSLFFSYTDEKKEISTFQSAYINLMTNEFKVINGIKSGFANAVDRDNHIVYLGGEDGVYTFDYKTESARRIEGTNHKIWHLFFKKNLYYTNYPDEQVYVFNKGKSEKLPELRNTRGMLVALDNNDNIYFSNSSGLFIYEKINKSISLIGDYTLNSFTNDKGGNLIFSTPNGIFYIDDKQKTVENLISMDNIYGVAVESNGSLICALEDSIVRLQLC